VYDASWLGYGNTFDLPVEHATYFSVAEATARIRALESRVEELERALGGRPRPRR
jgi:hypothetical protein